MIRIWDTFAKLGSAQSPMPNKHICMFACMYVYERNWKLMKDDGNLILVKEHVKKESIIFRMQTNENELPLMKHNRQN